MMSAASSPVSRVENLDHHDGDDPPDHLSNDEGRYRRRGDAGKCVAEHAANGDGRVGEAGRAGEEIRRSDA
jgi:hypothetical protein